MRKKLSYIYFAILITLLSCQVFATDWYVQPVTGEYGAEDGTSWATAFDGFADIAWGSISAGDNIYLSDGTYAEQLTVGASGSWNNYINILAGKYSPSPTGHDGEVIINHNYSGGAYGIQIHDARHWIKVKGITITQTGDCGISIKSTVNGGAFANPSHIWVDSCKIYEVNANECIEIQGYGNNWDATELGLTDTTRYVHHVEISRCTMYTHTNRAMPECNIIYGHLTGWLNIHHNFLWQRNYQEGQNEHIDPVQLAYSHHSVRIYNNIMATDSCVTGHVMIIGFMSRGSNYADTSIVYNNYFYSGGSYNCQTNWKQEILWRAPEGGTANQYLPLLYSINNDVISANGLTINSSPEGAYNPRESNNIIASFGQNGSLPSNYIGFWNSSYNTTEYKQVDSNKTNLAYMSWGGVDFGNNRWRGAGGSPTGNPSSWADFISADWGGTGVNANPSFANNFRITSLTSEPYELNANSPAINAGTDMTYILNKFEYLPMFYADRDILGNQRDGQWDIGAFEFQTGVADTIPTFSFTPVTGATRSQTYTATSVFLNADSTFHVSTSTNAQFKIGALGSYGTTMVEADSGDTVYVQNTASGSYSTANMETIRAGNNDQVFTVTTGSAPPPVTSGNTLRGSNGILIKDSTGQIIRTAE